jgi:hypothetical protein
MRTHLNRSLRNTLYMFNKKPIYPSTYLPLYTSKVFDCNKNAMQLTIFKISSKTAKQKKDITTYFHYLC